MSLAIFRRYFLTNSIIPGVMARVNLGRKRADVYSKAPLNDSDIRQSVARAGYSAKEIA